MRLPPEYADGLRISLSGGAHFDVEDHARGVVAVEPREGAGAVRDYFVTTKVADSGTAIDRDEPWAFLAVRPPALKPQPAVGIPPTLLSEWERLQGSPELAALVQKLSIETVLTEVELLPALFRRELPALFERCPNGSLWYVGVDDILLKRLTCMRLLSQLQVAPDSPVGAERQGVTYFGAHQLTGGLSFVEAVQPILLAFSPVVSGFTMNALPGAFCFSSVSSAGNMIFEYEVWMSSPLTTIPL
jgi:hypothetical protein